MNNVNDKGSEWVTSKNFTVSPMSALANALRSPALPPSFTGNVRCCGAACARQAYMPSASAKPNVVKLFVIAEPCLGF